MFALWVQGGGGLMDVNGPLTRLPYNCLKSTMICTALKCLTAVPH